MNNKQKNQPPILLPQRGILCAGYCIDCDLSRKHNSGWYYCTYKKRSVAPYEWHECFED